MGLNFVYGLNSFFNLRSLAFLKFWSWKNYTKYQVNIVWHLPLRQCWVFNPLVVVDVVVAAAVVAVLVAVVVVIVVVGLEKSHQTDDQDCHSHIYQATRTIRLADSCNISVSLFSVYTWAPWWTIVYRREIYYIYYILYTMDERSFYECYRHPTHGVLYLEVADPLVATSVENIAAWYGTKAPKTKLFWIS